MTSLFDLETQLQAAVRDIELLRNDIRSAFDGLDTQGQAIAATHTRIDKVTQETVDQYHGLLGNVARRLDGFENRFTALNHDVVGRVSWVEKYLSNTERSTGAGAGSLDTRPDGGG